MAVLGGGTIGLFTMQWAKILGAKSVTVFDINDKRLALAKKLGADRIINSTEMTDPDCQYAYIFETAGQAVTVRQAFQIAQNKATVCLIGTVSGDLTFTPKQWEQIHRKELKIVGSWMSYSDLFPGEEWEMTAHFFRTGQLKYDESMIFRKFLLDDIAEAFALYKQPGAVEGKIMICTEQGDL